MNKFIPNSFQTPNVLVDELMPLLTGDEWKVLCYMTRHILGFQDRIAQRRHYISLSTFVKGNKTYPGCGLGQNAIRTCLESLTKHRIIKAIDKPTAKGQLWELDYDSPDIDIDGLMERAQASSEKGKRRTASARSVRHNPYVKHNSSVGHKGTVMSDITPALMTDINTQTQSSNTPSNTLNTKDYAPFGAGLETPDPISLVENSKPTNDSILSKESRANAGATIPPKSSAKIPPAVSRWNDAQLNTYYVENKTDIDLIAAARGVNHDRVPFKNCLVGDRRETIKVHISILARQLEVVGYIKFLREVHFKWRKPFCVSLKELSSTIAIYESQLYPLKEVLDIPVTPPEELEKGFKTFAESQASIMGKGRAS